MGAGAFVLAHALDVGVQHHMAFEIIGIDLPFAAHLDQIGGAGSQVGVGNARHHNGRHPAVALDGKSHYRGRLARSSADDAFNTGLTLPCLGIVAPVGKAGADKFFAGLGRAFEMVPQHCAIRSQQPGKINAAVVVRKGAQGLIRALGQPALQKIRIGRRAHRRRCNR